MSYVTYFDDPLQTKPNILRIQKNEICIKLLDKISKLGFMFEEGKYE